MWSKKNNIEQTVHLSKVDSIILAKMTAEIFLRETLMLDTEKIYLAKFDIRAGNSPIEDLNNLSVVCLKSEVGEEMITLHYYIGGMKIILGYRSIDVSKFIQLSKALKSKFFTHRRDYLSNHLRYLKNDIVNISNIGVQEIICDVVRTNCLASGMTGVNLSIQEMPSLIEWLIVFSQMAQVLADGMDREESNTL